MRLTKSEPIVADTDFSEFRHFNFQWEHLTQEAKDKHFADFKACFEQLSQTVKPYVVTYGQLDNDGMFGNYSYTDEQLNKYVEHFFNKMDLRTTIDNKTDLQDTDHNWVFHKIKVQWLVNQARTVGLYSFIQARFKKIPNYNFKPWKQTNHEGEVHVHPGMSRVHAIRHMRDWDQKVILWDKCGYMREYDQKPLTFDEWYDLFDNINKTIFGAIIPDEILEVHVQEDRKGMYDAVKDIKEGMYKSLRPLLKGKCDDDIKDLFRHEGEETGVILETHNDYIFTRNDLRMFLDLYPGEVERVQDGNKFTITTK